MLEFLRASRGYSDEIWTKEVSESPSLFNSIADFFFSEVYRLPCEIYLIRIQYNGPSSIEKLMICIKHKNFSFFIESSK